MSLSFLQFTEEEFPRPHTTKSARDGRKNLRNWFALMEAEWPELGAWFIWMMQNSASGRAVMVLKSSWGWEMMALRSLSREWLKATIKRWGMRRDFYDFQNLIIHLLYDTSTLQRMRTLDILVFSFVKTPWKNASETVMLVCWKRNLSIRFWRVYKCFTVKILQLSTVISNHRMFWLVRKVQIFKI